MAQDLLSLPPEIVTEVLSHLPYGDLYLRAPLVCKLFHQLIKKPNPKAARQIDRTLWRDAPKPGLTGKTPAVLHPLLQYNTKTPLYTIEYDFEPNLSDVKFSKNKEDHTMDFEQDPKPLISHPLANENACSPGVGKAEYHRVRYDGKTHGGGIEIKPSGDGDRVTVIDVFRAVTDAIEDGCYRTYPMRSPFWDGIEVFEVTDGVLHLFDISHSGGKRPSTQRKDWAWAREWERDWERAAEMVAADEEVPAPLVKL